MDWLAFMEKKRTELLNTGHIMNDEMFIFHLLNSLPQVEYEGAILTIKDKLRKGTVHQEDDYALFTSHSNKKKSKKQFKGHCGYSGEYGHKAADCPDKKSSQNKGSRGKSSQKKKHSTKGENKGKGQKDMYKIKSYNCGEYGHFACNCPKPHDNANIAQENEQNKGFKTMLDLDNNSESEECAMNVWMYSVKMKMKK